MEFTLGQTDQAIQDTVYVLRKRPDHLQANFNLGIFYWQGRHDYPKATSQLEKVIELTASDTAQQAINADAKSKLAQVKKEQAAAEKQGSAGATSTGGVQ
jgi:tetratricopeptide (TPR) repeat protein